MTRASLSAHMRLHNGTGFKCHLCGKNHALLTDLKRHMESSMHNNVRKFGCLMCKRSFVKKSHLTRHVTAVHRKIIPYESKCLHCSRRVTSRHRELHLCVDHINLLGLPSVRPHGVSRQACTCFDTISETFDIDLCHVHFTSPHSYETTGSEMEDTIPGTKFRPDAYDRANPLHIYEFLGNAWHGYPREHPLHDAVGHIGVPFKELYTTTMARLHLFKDHGYVVHYIWAHEWSVARTPGELLRCIHVVQ